MKDENCHVPMIDYVGLRSKLYVTRNFVTKDDLTDLRKSLQEEFDEDEIEEIILECGEKKRAKGVKSSVVQNKITFDDYVEYLESYIENVSVKT